MTPNDKEQYNIHIGENPTPLATCLRSMLYVYLHTMKYLHSNIILHYLESSPVKKKKKNRNTACSHAMFLFFLLVNVFCHFTEK